MGWDASGQGRGPSGREGAGRVTQVVRCTQESASVRSRGAVLCEIQGAVLCAASPSSLPRTPALWFMGCQGTFQGTEGASALRSSGSV